MAFDKSDYSDDNISVTNFYRALSCALKNTSKEPLAVFEQLLDAGLTVSIGPLGHVGDTPIHPGDIKVAIRKAKHAGKQGEELFDVPIKIPGSNASERLSPQKLGEFRKQERILQNKMDLAVKREEHDTREKLTGEVAALSQTLRSPSKVNLSELYVNRANADAACRALGEDSSPWPGTKAPRQQTDPMQVFQVMDNLMFSEITICVDPVRRSLKISARDKNAYPSLSRLDLTQKGEVYLNRQGKVFMAMADRTFNDQETGASRAVTHLSRNLRDAFGTQDPPFKKMKPRFQLHIPKDKEAKQRAERNTVSFVDNIKVTGDRATQEFLKNNDPEYSPYDTTYDDHDLDLGADD